MQGATRAQGFPSPRALLLSLALFSGVASAPCGAGALTPEQARAAYARFQSLEGRWDGRSTKGWTDRGEFRVIAAGSVVMHTSFDAHPNETMVTMIHLDRDRLLLTHYCVARNQPRLVATQASEDGRTITFEFLDGTNLASRDRGHMDKVVYAFPDTTHYTSRWTWYQDGEESWMEQIEHVRAQDAVRPEEGDVRP